MYSKTYAIKKQSKKLEITGEESSSMLSVSSKFQVMPEKTDKKMENQLSINLDSRQKLPLKGSRESLMQSGSQKIFRSKSLNDINDSKLAEMSESRIMSPLADTHKHRIMLRHSKSIVKILSSTDKCGVKSALDLTSEKRMMSSQTYNDTSLNVTSLNECITLMPLPYCNPAGWCKNIETNINSTGGIRIASTPVSGSRNLAKNKETKSILTRSISMMTQSQANSSKSIGGSTTITSTGSNCLNDSSRERITSLLTHSYSNSESITLSQINDSNSTVGSGIFIDKSSSHTSLLTPLITPLLTDVNISKDSSLMTARPKLPGLTDQASDSLKEESSTLSQQS